MLLACNYKHIAYNRCLESTLLLQLSPYSGLVRALNINVCLFQTYRLDGKKDILLRVHAATSSECNDCLSLKHTL